MALTKLNEGGTKMSTTKSSEGLSRHHRRFPKYATSIHATHGARSAVWIRRVLSAALTCGIVIAICCDIYLLMAFSFVNKPEAEAQLIGALDPIDPVVLNAST